MKLNILAIDKDSDTLTHIKELLNSLKIEGNFFFTENEEEALSIMSENQINLVLSDIRTPQVNGVDFLDIIKEKYSSAIRVVLFEQKSKIDLLLTSVVSSHKFIAKPIELEKFETILLQTVQLNNLLASENLRKVINKIKKFPTLPQTYIDIEAELNKDSFSLQKISDIIYNDIFVTTRILQVVNSPYFGLAQSITDIRQAVNLLGITMIKSIILYTQIFCSFEGNMRVEQLQKSIWEHSLQVAHNSKKLISHLWDKKDAETAYIAGLLHDIGKIIVINTEEFIYDILKLMKAKNIEYNEAEKIVLGTTHAEIGGYLLSLWGLPQIIVDSVLNHHDISKIDREKFSILSSVFFANIISKSDEIASEFFIKNGYERFLHEITPLFK
ncbi:MAG: HDOD domain-containing protein [Bacteroidetes bacterium]|nr:HDOD domain-containing protein [Bacteroidota bacterium]MBU1116261.1 HDOD domain-containing protein [Bacteroidota bacterium]MBU1799759.1 HDOD domain-containing protein [Bacteroidota bacterium]